jgi:hypothetical protein
MISKTVSLKRYKPVTARFEEGIPGFSSIDISLLPHISATPNLSGSGTSFK